MVKADLQPTLVGDSLLLRPLTEDDWEGMYAVASDPLLWEVHPAWDRYKEPVFREYFAGAMASHGALARVMLAHGNHPKTRLESRCSEA